MGPPPVVTGISPKEGPPGTRVTVRGEFLGNKAQDLTGQCDIIIDTIIVKFSKLVPDNSVNTESCFFIK